MFKGTFHTRNLNVAVYLLAAGAPMPELREEGRGFVAFEFADPDGEWKKAASSLDLGDTENDVCPVPVARVFAAQRILRDAVSDAKGRARLDNCFSGGAK